MRVGYPYAVGRSIGRRDRWLGTVKSESGEQRAESEARDRQGSLGGEGEDGEEGEVRVHWPACTMRVRWNGLS